MSNTNNRQQPAPANNKPPVPQPESPPAQTLELRHDEEKESNLKSAVVLCLNLLLRTSTLGHLPRSHESEIKEAIKSLEPT